MGRSLFLLFCGQPVILGFVPFFDFTLEFCLLFFPGRVGGFVLLALETLKIHLFPFPLLLKLE